MRMMDFLFSGLFWGLLIIFFGLSIVIKTVFHIDLHLGRIFFAVILILWGISLLTGRHIFHGRTYRESGSVTTFFSEGRFGDGPIQREYSVIFGKEVIDLRDWDPQRDPINIEVNAIFGSAEILLPKGVTASVKGSAVFGAAQFPDGQTAAFGERSYRQGGSDTGTPSILKHRRYSVTFRSSNRRELVP